MDVDDLGFRRETEMGEMIRKESVEDQDYNGRDNYGAIVALTYRKEGPDGSSRNLNISEDGLVTLYGKQTMPEAYGLEDEVFQYQTTLTDLGRGETASYLVWYHEEEKYDELDEILHEIEGELFDTR